MFISHLLVRHKPPKPRFAPGAFMGALIAFVILGQDKPVVGLVGMGITMVLTGILVELNRESIWQNYVKGYRKQKGLKGLWTRPNDLYYTINVVFLWPFIIFLGVICIWAAYVIA